MGGGFKVSAGGSADAAADGRTWVRVMCLCARILHHFHDSDGRLRVGLSAGSSGPWMTAASSWRSGFASTVSRRTGSSTAGGARFGHNAVLRAFVAVACGCATWLHVVRIRVNDRVDRAAGNQMVTCDGETRPRFVSAFRVRGPCAYLLCVQDFSPGIFRRVWAWGWPPVRFILDCIGAGWGGPL